MRRQNLYNMAAMAALAGVMMAGSVMSAFATGWQENEKGRWYGTNEDNTEWYKETSEWIDDNGDNIAECYYFDKDGYLITNRAEDEGLYNATNENGAWIKDGVVVTRVADLRALPVPQASEGTSNAAGWKNEQALQSFFADSRRQYSPDGITLYKDGWYWIDDDNDNIAECYYFGKDGYTDPWGNQGYYNTNEDGAWREGSITQTRVVDWSKVSNVAYDVRDYDSQGVSKAAVDILLHTWEENKKYGDTSDNTPQSVYYTNGLYASYDYSKDGHPSWVRVDADDRELIFREPLKGADGAVESLKAKGYDAKWVTPYNHSWGIEITNLWDGRITISGTVNGTNHFLKLEGHNSNYTNWGQDWGY